LATIHEALINQNPQKNGPWDVKNARHHEHGTPVSGWKIQNRNADPEMEKKLMFLFDFCFGIWVFQITAWFF